MFCFRFLYTMESDKSTTNNKYKIYTSIDCQSDDSDSDMSISDDAIAAFDVNLTPYKTFTLICFKCYQLYSEVRDGMSLFVRYEKCDHALCLKCAISIFTQYKYLECDKCKTINRGVNIFTREAVIFANLSKSDTTNDFVFSHWIDLNNVHLYQEPKEILHLKLSQLKYQQTKLIKIQLKKLKIATLEKRKLEELKFKKVNPIKIKKTTTKSKTKK
ncbi:Immediate early protein 2 [Lonomia obliqua multiple nucleopolyhedrovirus]|uniref:Immediate early protein 2 n=1 Tax=Lonomia obliqua multiple nucleopolyhedrovirus TaxID=134394 RepID=A0A126FCB9_9ABAC|nr:Immediate early protein 2 [Lonomia obliqua multiple nucleopolyhedrovirus]AKN81019.1 Immediate early protein 2 [Lonomia obliqua multiple nucleopolyhedrovirus]